MSYRGGYGGYERQHSSNSNSGDSRVPNEPPWVAFVGNLPSRLIQGDIEQIFKNQKVKSVRMLRDRETDEFRGSAFVEFHDKNSLVEGLGLNNAMLEDRSIRVDIADRKRNDRDGGNRRDDRPDHSRDDPRHVPGRGSYPHGGRDNFREVSNSDTPRGGPRYNNGGGRNFDRQESYPRSNQNLGYGDRSSGFNRGGQDNYSGRGGFSDRRGGFSNGNFSAAPSYARGYGGRYSHNGPYGGRESGGSRDYNQNNRGYTDRGGYSSHRGGRHHDRDHLADNFSDMKVADPADAALRPKLVLQPRTVAAPLNTLAEASERTRQIFGDAKPRDAKESDEVTGTGSKGSSVNGSTSVNSAPNN